jgi:hypothetical protein
VQSSRHSVGELPVQSVRSHGGWVNRLLWLVRAPCVDHRRRVPWLSGAAPVVEWCGVEVLLRWWCAAVGGSRVRRFNLFLRF